MWWLWALATLIDIMNMFTPATLKPVIWHLILSSAFLPYINFVSKIIFILKPIKIFEILRKS